MKKEKNVAVITGGAQGIGYAIANRLGNMGYEIHLWDLNHGQCEKATQQLNNIGIEAFSYGVDISNEDKVANAFDRVINKCSQIHVVINAAGIVGPNGVKTEDVLLSEFETTCKVNLLGSFIVLKHAVRTMKPFNFGRILMISSIAGKDGNAGMSAYSSSKAGVIGLIKAAGKEYADTGITINAIAPATIMTPLVEAMHPEQVTYMTDRIPMKRCGTLEEIASLASWIVSKEASFNTGFTFDLSGGRAVY